MYIQLILLQVLLEQPGILLYEIQLEIEQIPGMHTPSWTRVCVMQSALVVMFHFAVPQHHIVIHVSSTCMNSTNNYNLLLLYV